MYLLIRFFFITGFIIQLLQGQSQDKPKIFPDLSVQKEPIPYINLNNGQRLDSIHFYRDDPEFFYKRNYNYYSSSGLKVKSISFTREKENKKWWQSFTGNFSYDQTIRLMGETLYHLKLFTGKPVILTFRNVYDTNSNRVYKNYFFWNTDKKNLLDFGHEDLTYNDTGLLEEIQHHSWRGKFDLDESFSTIEYKYNEDGLLKKFTISFYVDWLGKVVPVTEYSYTYDEKLNLTLKFIRQWDKRAEKWNDLAKKLYFYKDSLLTRVDIYSFEQDSWILTSNLYYIYEDWKLVEYIEKAKDKNSQEIINKTREDFHYDENGQLISFIRNDWDISMNTWIQKSKRLWTYNEVGNITTVNYYYKDKSNSLKLKSRKLYFWHNSDSPYSYQKIVRIKLCKVYPNPVRDRLLIKSINDTLLPVRYSLAKISGELVQSGVINSSFHSIITDKLGSEMYMLILQSGNWVQTEKIFKL